MATEIVMPKLGLTMESGTISNWLVAEGDEVKKGQAQCSFCSMHFSNASLKTESTMREAYR